MVNADQLPDSGYLRAKVAQEQLISSSGIAYSIVRATQFFEFFQRIADEATEGTTVRLPDALIQPMAADDVAAAVARVAVAAPVNGIVEIGGPVAFTFEDFIRTGLQSNQDRRNVVADPRAMYFGAALEERSLLPGTTAQLAATTFEDWLTRSMSAA